MKKLLLLFLIFLFLLTTFYLKAQNGTITTIAGENTGNNVQAMQFGVNPYSAVSDNAGNVYIADASNHIIHKLNISTGMLTVYAGTGSCGFSGDGGPATNAQFNYPLALALDNKGNLYVVDESTYCVREIDHSTGIITTVAGRGGWWGFGGDGGPATAAYFNNPIAIAIDSANNLYISDYSNNRIRKVMAGSGIINTIAGSDSIHYTHDSIAADTGRINGPAGLALDKKGNVYFVDQNNCRIRMLDTTNHIIYTLSGGNAGFSGDGGPAPKARFWYPIGIALDSLGNIYIGDTYDNRIREITRTNDTINTVCGNGWSAFAGDGGPAATAEVYQPRYLSFDKRGNLFFGDIGNNRVREINNSDTINTISGDGMPGYNGNNIAALSSQLSNPTNIVSDDSGNIYVSDNGNNMIRKVDAASGKILKIAGTGRGGYGGDGGPAGKALLSGPLGMAINDSGDIVFADEYNERIRKISHSTNTITTIAGNGSAGYAGNGGEATSAKLFYPADIAIDSKGDIYIADMINDRIREVNTFGIMKLTAGNGYNSNNWGGGFSGDGGSAIIAELDQPQSVAFDNSGNLYIADTWNYRVRKVDMSNGIITTVAGNGTWGYSGDGGPATAAQISPPTCIRFDPYGNLYIADFYNNAIREVSVWDSSITTVAGTGTQNYGGDGGPAISAYLDLPHGICFDIPGNMYIADYGNNRIREITSPLAVKNLVKGGGISVFPNPADAEIFVAVSGLNLNHASIELMDITGRTVLQKDISNHYSAAPMGIDVSNLSPGIYFVNLKCDSGQFTSKVVKN